MPNERADTADFIPVATWERLTEVCGNNLTKCRLVLVEGRLQIRTYETDGGGRRKVAEVVAGSVEFLDGKPQESVVGISADHAGTIGQDVGWAEEIPF